MPHVILRDLKKKIAIRKPILTFEQSIIRTFCWEWMQVNDVHYLEFGH